MKPQGNKSQHNKARYDSHDHEAAKKQYHAARAEISYVADRVQELVRLGYQTQGIQEAIQRSHIMGTLAHNTRGFNVLQLQSYASELLTKLFNLEQEIVRGNERKTWDKDLRLVFVYEAMTLVECAKQLDDAELTAYYNELVLSRKSATARYNLDREGLNNCICDVLNYVNEDELRDSRTEEIFKAGGFSSYLTANTRARNLISAERFADLIQSTPIYRAPKASPQSDRKKRKRRK